MENTAYPIPLEFIRFLNQVLDLPIREQDKKKKLDGAIRDINLIQKEFDESLDYFIVQPIKKEISNSIANLLEYHFRKIMEDYLQHIVKKIPVDGLSREEIMRVLSSFIAKRCFDFLNSLPEEFRLSKQDIISLFNKDKFSMPFILNKMDENLDWVAYCLYLSHEDKEKIRRYNSGEYIPSVQAINLLLNVKDLNKTWLNKMKLWLIIARARDVLRRYGIRFDNFDITSDQDISIFDKKIILLQQNSIQKIVPNFILRNYEFLYNVLIGNSNSDKDKIQERLEESYNYLQECELLCKMNYHWDRFYARFYLFSGEIDKAIEYYEKSFKNALFRGGESLKYIIQDSLIAVSYREKVCGKSERKFLAHLKHAMILFDIEPLSVEEKPEKINHKGLIKDWEVDTWARQFHLYFGKERWFDGVNYQEISPKMLSLVPNELERYKPDYKKVNQVLKIKDCHGYKFKELPQLVWFSLRGNNDAVKRLLESGADVNLLSSSEESALSIALYSMAYDEYNRENPELINMLINIPHKEDVINKKWSKKGHFPLYLAVATGKSEYVRKILEMGANVDEWHSVNQESSLMLAMKMIQEYKDPEKLADLFVKNPLHQSDQKFVDDYRRRNYGINNDVGYRTYEQRFELAKLLLLSYKERLDRNSSLEELYSIVKLLLEYGANPNFEYDIRSMKGYTPLMLSVEYNDRRLFDLFIKFGGDILKPVFYQIEDRLYYCKDIKEHWRSNEIPL